MIAFIFGVVVGLIAYDLYTKYQISKVFWH